MAVAALWGDRLGEEAAALNQTAPVDLRVNMLKSNRGDAKRALADVFIDEEEGSISSPCIANVTGLKGHGVSTARAAGFLCEVISDTLIKVGEGWRKLGKVTESSRKRILSEVAS